MKRKPLLFILIGLLIAAGIAGTVVLSQRSSEKKRSTSTPAATQQKIDPTQPAQVPASPAGNGTTNKRACDLFDASLARTAVGSDAVKNDKLPAIITLQVISSSCEYAGSGKKASVTLYLYKSDEAAAADKANVQKQAVVLSKDGKTSSVQPRQSAAEAKGKYVVVSVVTDGAAFNLSESNKLLQEVLKKL